MQTKQYKGVTVQEDGTIICNTLKRPCTIREDYFGKKIVWAKSESGNAVRLSWNVVIANTFPKLLHIPVDKRPATKGKMQEYKTQAEPYSCWMNGVDELYL